MAIISTTNRYVCVKVHKSYLSKLRVTVKPVSLGAASAVYVCGVHVISKTDIEKKCELGVYELESEGASLKQVASAKEKTYCKVLEFDDK